MHRIAAAGQTCERAEASARPSFLSLSLSFAPTGKLAECARSSARYSKLD